MSKHLVIINPHANSGKAGDMIAVVSEILRNEDVDYVTTKHPAHATDVAAGASEYDIVIVIGGDGTIHEVTNGLMTIPAEQRPALALVPSGSGNDSVRMAGVPLDVSAALMNVLTGTPQPFDVGLCNGVYFLNSCSIGIDALVVAKTNELKATRKLTGSRLYVQALLHVITHNLHSVDVSLSIDGSPVEERRVMLCAVTNGKTYGSGIAINPSANPSDGLLTTAYVDSLSMGRVLAALPQLAAKKHERIKEFHFKQFKELTLSSRDGSAMVAQRDGEIFTDHEFHFSVVPGALKIIVPTQDRQPR